MSDSSAAARRWAATASLVFGAPAFAAEVADQAPPPTAEPTAEPADEPAAPAHRLVGAHRRYEPLLGTRLGGFRLELPLSAAFRMATASSLPLDADGETHEVDAPEGDAQVRVGALIDSAEALGFIKLKAEFELDVVTGPVAGGPGAACTADVDACLAEEARSFHGSSERQLRKAYGRLSVGPMLTLNGGYQVSHWGLGLLANDGAHGFTPGSAAFADPRGGDRVLRVSAATGPWTRQHIVLTGGYDWVQDDDVTLSGDEATQMIGALVIGYEKPRTAGIYVARRHQEADSGKVTDVTAIDFYGRWTHRVGDALRYTTELEAAYVTGETDLSPTRDFPTHEVRQFGAVGRLNFDFGTAGGLLDVTWASGDQNFDDGEQNGFKADPNFEQGLFLFRHVIASITAQAPTTASDLELVGRPSEDLDRLPTRGSVTNTVAFFPRGWWRPIDGLEIYAGPLFALAEVSPSDPLQARFAGGAARNAFGGEPGGYLGTELDLGVRYRALMAGAELEVGAEGGLFLPGSAFDDAAGDPALDTISGGRAFARLRL